MKLKHTAAAILTSLALSGCGSSSDDAARSSSFEHNLNDLQSLLNTNADIAFATYSDSVDTAVDLQTAITTFAAAAADGVSEAELDAVKTAWLVSREPYGQTEVYRFRDSPIDDADGPEGSINAWPLGEALIDYVMATGSDFGTGQVETDHTVVGVTDPLTTAAAVNNDADNIIGDVTVTINAALLAQTEAGDGADVIAGYHAIEFLLWGQDLDLNGAVTVSTNRETAVKTRPNHVAGGDRPTTDFDLQGNGTCTTGTANAAAANDTPYQRRHDYLAVAAQQLVDDLTAVRDEWAQAGAYRAIFTNVASINAAKPKFLEILTGMGTLSIGELAGERMQIAFAANSQEDEHSCFSDNTHRDIWLNAEGVLNAYNGSYAGYDSTLDGIDDITTNAVNGGYGIADYLADRGETTLAAEVAAALALTETNYTAIDTLARAGTPVDVQIMPPLDATDPMAETIVSLNAQATLIAQIAIDLDLGSKDDVIDPEGTACDTSDPLTVCP